MPIPKPRKGEQESKFIGRWMDNEIMKRDYPDSKQRVAVCYDSWRRRRSGTIRDASFGLGAC